mmetsp:Transcript_23859/g.94622  ORF Transcript_23859/g.94622 Transcript_23859/m.94622 type:complete len:639 (+) Transcript_23859:142-2058(+)
MRTRDRNGLLGPVGGVCRLCFGVVVVAWTTTTAPRSSGGGGGHVAAFAPAPPPPVRRGRLVPTTSLPPPPPAVVAPLALFSPSRSAEDAGASSAWSPSTRRRRRVGAVSLPRDDLGPAEVAAQVLLPKQAPQGGGAADAAPPAIGAETTKAAAESSTAPAKKRVLILMSDTGGGHRASAQALAHALRHVYGDETLDCEILDIWTEYAPWPYKNFVPYYAFLAKHPVLWRAAWGYARFPVTRRLQEAASLAQCYQQFREAVEERWPVDLVVSVHPLCQTIPLRVLNDLDADDDDRRALFERDDADDTSTAEGLVAAMAKTPARAVDAVARLGAAAWNRLGLPPVLRVGRTTGRTTPFVTVVTDLGSAHPTWFHKRVDACFVPSDAVRKVARRVGVPEHKIRQHGLPLREAFWQPEPRPKADLRAALDLPADQTTALVVGGGDGVGRISRLAKEIATELGAHDDDDDDVDAAAAPSRATRRTAKTTLVVVCGKNADAKRELEAHAWPASVDARILGFVTNMDEYMAAADCIVTKAGPGTIAEASTRRLPTLISSYLPGQEAGNVKFVTRDFKFGEYRRRPKRIAKTIKRWLRDDTERSALAERAESAATRDATTKIARDIGAFLFGSDAEARTHERPPSS